MIAHTNPILSSVITIYDKLKGSKLDESVLNEIDESLSNIAKFYNLDKTETLFFVLIFSLQNQDDKEVSLHRIAEYLEYPFLGLLAYRYVIDSLENKSLIYLTERKNISHHPENNGYRVCGSVSNCVIEGEAIKISSKKQKTLEDVICEILFIEANHGNIGDIEYSRQIEICERNNQHFEIIKNITSMFPDDFDSRVLLYYFCYSTIYGEECWEPIYRRQKYETNAFFCLPQSSVDKRRREMFNNKDILFDKRLLEKYQRNNVFGSGDFASFQLSKKGIKVLFGKDSKKYSYNDERTELDFIMLGIKEISSIYEDPKTLILKIHQFKQAEKNYCKYTYFKQVRRLVPNDNNRLIYFNCVKNFLDSYGTDIGKSLMNIYGRSPSYFNELRNFVDEKHPLVENGLVEIMKNEVVERTTMTLTEKSIELLYGENADLYYKQTKLKNVLLPEEIKSKSLFYDIDIKNQIEMLNDSLTQENLLLIQNRLESKGLCKGVAAILYGAPGTGKTETVYQLAKKTDRKIVHVNIADSKSKWFGESEKCIKKIFTDYRLLCKSCMSHGENTPILLFNEADAIISKRGTLESNSIMKTENTMQNILLEEMEKLDGIIIATTNLCENMDGAFERRFLFKIKFEKPTAEARMKIWKSKFESISDDDAYSLASEFDFSGGEIDNIVRKCEMNEIITGVQPDYNNLIELCSQERLKKEGERRMGFVI